MARLSIRSPRLALTACLLLAGCQQEAITTYRAPRLEKPPPRLLGAIAPVSDFVWFVKFVGPAPEIAAHAGDFDKFVGSLRFDDPQKHIAWTLPDNWRETVASPAKGGLAEQTRYATFRVKPEGLKVTVSRLGREAGELLPNINRWRKNDLDLPPIGDAELPSVTRNIDGASHPITIVDMTAGTESPPPAAPEKPEHLAYDVPPGWQPQPPGVMRLAAFKATAGDKSAEITVTMLPGQAGGLLANVNRWRDQLGLPAITAPELQKQGKMLDSKAGSVVTVDLTGPKGRMLAGILLHGGQSWFVKMTGPPEFVGQQQQAFETFVKSLRFEAGAK
jgi:hypothetical protein